MVSSAQSFGCWARSTRHSGCSTGETVTLVQLQDAGGGLSVAAGGALCALTAVQATQVHAAQCFRPTPCACVGVGLTDSFPPRRTGHHGISPLRPLQRQDSMGTALCRRRKRIGWRLPRHIWCAHCNVKVAAALLLCHSPSLSSLAASLAGAPSLACRGHRP